MVKYFLPTILVGAAIGLFFLFVVPTYDGIQEKRIQVLAYNEALDNSKALEAERDKLTQKFNAFSKDDVAKLEKLLPDQVDNIRLILEIERLASPYGMVLKDVKYDTDKGTPGASPQDQVLAEQIGGLSPKDYNTLDLEFTTQGTYDNFVSFLKDIESNLRIVDIDSIEFTTDFSIEGIDPNVPQAYKYTFKIKTYWLKG